MKIKEVSTMLNSFYTLWLKRPIDEKPELLDEYPIIRSKKEAFRLAKELLRDINPNSEVHVRYITLGSMECDDYVFTREDI